MSDQQRQELFVRLSTGLTSPAQRLTSASISELRYQHQDQGREDEWLERLRSLQDWICELLIKNEQLRTALAVATAHQAKETDQ